jgi:Tat protein secretion system quality control protein TatD with DNase activity
MLSTLHHDARVSSAKLKSKLSSCHPTDTMSSIASIPTMKTAGLTIMGTRLEDQRLIAEVARSHPISKIVPSFGYHPWFSHLIFDDTVITGEIDEAKLKQSHYGTVLVPPPDEDFISQLPVPRPLKEVIEEIKAYLEEFPQALVGEIGLDRGFRLPYPSPTHAGPAGSTPSRREGAGLTQHRVNLEHQKTVFKAQLRLAGDFGRAVSVHGVQCHGALFDTFRELWTGHEIPCESRKDQKRRRRKCLDGGHEYLPDLADSDIESEEEEDMRMPIKPRPFPPRICLHSFGAPLQTLKQYLAPPTPTKLYPSQMFFSFSSTINARPEKGHLGKIGETIKAVPDECLLIESDLHTAGEELDEALGDALLLVSEIKGWGLEDGAKQLGGNWKRFVFGDLIPCI